MSGFLDDIIHKEGEESPEVKIPPEYIEWLKQNWFPVALIIALYATIAIATWVVRKR